MKADNISNISIDDLGRLCVFPEKQKFTLIWRSATEVHWDNSGFLYSPKPREWSYFDWYRHIISVIKVEECCILSITNNTEFTNISHSLKDQILQFKL